MNSTLAAMAEKQYPAIWRLTKEIPKQIRLWVTTWCPAICYSLLSADLWHSPQFQVYFFNSSPLVSTCIFCSKDLSQTEPFQIWITKMPKFSGNTFQATSHVCIDVCGFLRMAEGRTGSSCGAAPILLFVFSFQITLIQPVCINGFLFVSRF